MATKTLGLGVLMVVHHVTAGTASSYWIDTEEFTSSQYGVHIARRPISVEQHYDPNQVLLLSSKVGQQYRCSLPISGPVSDQSASDGSESEANAANVADLLKSMESAPCLMKTKDWWTYEFCYGKEIRQFHLHNGQIHGDVISLGVYESEFDWTLAEQEKAKKSRLSRYHSQQYVNGSRCDLTGSPRKAEVRFYCGEGDVDRLTAVAESQTCAYTLHITTAKICSSIYLRPRNRPRSLSVVCEPVVSEEDYQIFLRKEAEEKEKKLQENVVAATSAGTDLNKGHIVSFEQMLKDTVEKQFGFDLGDFEMHFMDDGNSLEQVLEEVMKQSSQPSQLGGTGETATPNEGAAQTIQPESGTAPSQQVPLQNNEVRLSSHDAKAPVEENSGQEAHLPESEEMIQLRKEIKELGVEIESMTKYKENIQHAVSSKFADILEEAQRELRDEGVNADIDRDAAFKHMAASLASLLDSMGHKDKTKAAGDGVKDETEAKMSVNKEIKPAVPEKGQLSLPNVAVSKEPARTPRKISVQRIRIEPKVEVKMVDISDMDGDPAYEGNEDMSRPAADTLTENRHVRTVIAVLQPAGREARKEEARQREMEDTYNQLWTRRRKNEL